VFRRTVELGASGKCKGWHDIQEKLVEKGYRHAPDLVDRDASELNALKNAGFFVSSRKPRSLFQDNETLELVERIEERLRLR
jgi:hypothetical protein